MLSRRMMIQSGLALAASTCLPPQGAAAEKAKAAKDKGKAKPGSIKLAPVSITALTQVFGDGQKLTAVTLEYPEPIDTSKLDANSFGVRTRRIRRIYANTTGLPSETPENGRFVIVELSPKDATAALYALAKGSAVRTKAVAAVMQKGTVVTAAGKSYPPNTDVLEATAVRNLVVDDFKPFTFKDPKTGETLAYNLFTPRDYDPKKRYPLVLFMHDAGASSTAVDTTLVQGLGAVVWASPEDQAKRPCFVLAPQYAAPVVNDRSEATGALDVTVNLLKDVASRFSIDDKRLYATGQSGGGMMAIAMNLKYPDLFAASFIVAGQWDPALVRPLAKQKLWIMVSEGDAKAYPGENGMLTVMEQEGAKISRAVWDGRATPETLAEAVTLMESARTPINYVALKKGTVVPPGFANDAGANHVNTWRIAYGIEGIRDWLFQQKKG